MLTVRGIAYDLTKSPYKSEILYNKEKMTFKFSSKMYETKFNEKLAENRNKINESLSKRFGFNISSNLLSDIILYSKIEKRGFLIFNEKESFTCLNNIKLDGHNKIYQS